MQSVNAYEETKDELEQFVLEHRHIVKKIALFIKRKLPSFIEFDDLLQSGLIGLLEAKQHYKPGTGASFETYASIRIRGAIIDSLRKDSWMSRDTLKNMKKMSDAISKIEQRDQKQATTEKIAEELGISIEEHFKLCHEINMSHILSLNVVDENDSMLGSDQNDPQTINQNEGMKERLKDILAELPEKEKLVLSLYYVEELTLKQIGEVLELTEARVCQLHSQAIARVRSKMNSENIIDV